MHHVTEARLEKFIAELQGAQGQGFDFVVHTIKEQCRVDSNCGVAQTLTAVSRRQ